MSDQISCGIAVIRLLESYGVDMVFGIPGVHTLEFCRGLNASSIRHIQARNEQGAGMMAEGVARSTGKPGVALVISGPGVTNITTALGQAWADSLPVLVISAETPSDTHGKGLGELHEITEQSAVTRPLTALSQSVSKASEVPALFATAFEIFSSRHPRPVHISIPIDVLEETVSSEDFEANWVPVPPSPPAVADTSALDAAAELLLKAQSPLILTGGGANACSSALETLATALGAPVVSSTAGKGILDDQHPLALGGGVTRAEAHQLITASDCVLAIGTELSQPDSFDSVLTFGGKLIRIDIDPDKIADRFPADIGIVADAGQAIAALAERIKPEDDAARYQRGAEAVKTVRSAMQSGLSSSEEQHLRLLKALRECTPDTTKFSGDACQIMYTGAWAMPVRAPRQWFFPSGYCTLGCAVPTAIGAKLANPETPVVALTGDGGFMFTVQELLTAAEQALPIPIVLWDNGGYKQIRDDMDRANIRRIGVEGLNPDFAALANACRCDAQEPESIEQFKACINDAFTNDRPTLIGVVEDTPWLKA